MSKQQIKTINDLQKQGFKALVRELGPVNAVRFLQSYDPGSGNYTKERKQWLDDDIDRIYERIKKSRNDSK